MVLSFSKAADAMMFSVGWQAVEMTTSGEIGGRTRKLAMQRIELHLKERLQISVIEDRAVCRTCVSLELLHDLLGLQVPDINHVVF